MRNAYANRLKERRILSTEDLRAYVPSAFATQPAEGVSDRYVFVPTIEIIENVRAKGFIPVFAGQSRARSAEGHIYTKHMIRFQHESQVDSTADLKPEILLTNSHNRTSGIRFAAGVFRLVCSNGLVVMDQSYGSLSCRHTGEAAGKVVELTESVAEIAQNAIERAREMSKVHVTEAQQKSIARKAAALRYKDDDFRLVEGLLVPKRDVECNPENGALPKPDLFTTVNVIQENIMTGKIQRTLPSGRKSSTHAVNSVQADLNINRGIWKIAEEAAAELTA